MSRTYKRPRTINKARKSRAVERVQKETRRILSHDEMMEFIECLNEAMVERDADS
jgi:urease gamma subunit